MTKLINVSNGDKVETYILTKLLITKENIMSRFKDHLMQKEQELDEQIIYMNKMINDRPIVDGDSACVFYKHNDGETPDNSNRVSGKGWA